MGKLLLLFTIVPLLELYLLLLFGELMGFWPTVLVVLVTGVVGAWLAKREGLRVFTTWRESIEAGRMPEEGVLGGLLVLVGGVLLVTPGVLTDITGLLLLFPPSRKLVALHLRRAAEKKIRDGSVQVISSYQAHVADAPLRPSRPRPGVIDVEGEVIDVDVERPPQMAK